MSKKTIRLTESQLKEYISKIVSEQPQVQRPQVQQQKPQSGMTQAMLNSPYAKETKIWSDFFNKYYKMNLPVDGNWKNPNYNKTLERYYKEKNIPVYVCQTNDSYCGSGSEGVVTTKDKTGGELRAIRQQDMTKLGGQQPQPVNESINKKTLRLTESQLREYIQKLISEQPDDEHPQHTQRRNIDTMFKVIRVVKDNHSCKLVNYRGDNKRVGVIDTDKMSWIFDPVYTETNMSLDENTNTIITKYTDPNGVSFYTLEDIDTLSGNEIPEVIIASNENTLNMMGFTMN